MRGYDMPQNTTFSHPTSKRQQASISNSYRRREYATATLWLLAWAGLWVFGLHKPIVNQILGAAFSILVGFLPLYVVCSHKPEIRPSNRNSVRLVITPVDPPIQN